jgi:hypothetical protein
MRSMTTRSMGTSPVRELSSKRIANATYDTIAIIVDRDTKVCGFMAAPEMSPPATYALKIEDSGNSD